MIQKIDHLGVAVRSLEESVRFYRSAFGLECDRIEEVASQQVRIAYLRVGESCIELIEPTSTESPIAKFLLKRGEGLHHVALATSDLNGTSAAAVAAGCQFIDREPIQGGAEKMVMFLHPKSTHGVLIELCCGGRSEV